MLDKIILFPYWLSLKLRNARYNRGGKRVHASEAPSICVGNITAGGTGKTPHVELILRLLRESGVWGEASIAVLSRGYKRRSRGFQEVRTDSTAAEAGDEPLQIKKNFPDVTVAVDKDRVEGCDLLRHPDKKGGEYPAADLIVLDDAYQYRRLKADCNIVLVDWNRPLRKDSLLPMGRLRDLPERVMDADVVIVTKCPSELEDDEKRRFASGLWAKEYDPETCRAVNSRGRSQLILFTTVRYCASRGVFPTMDTRYIYSKKLIMVTGIAKDTPLRNYLSDSYRILHRFNFPDHHRYTRSDISGILSAVRRDPVAAVATTEKDAQRLLDYKDMPSEIMQRMFLVPIEAEFLSGRELGVFKGFLDSLRRA